MADILYFIPAAVGGALTERKRLGLTGILGSKGITSRLVSQGPVGERGVVLTRDAARCGYFPGEQTWREIDGLWLGIWKDDPPTPSELEREPLVGGYEVELGDGNHWLVPVIRPIDGRTPDIPLNYDLAADGEMILRPDPNHEWLIEAGERIYEALTEQGPEEITVPDGFTIAAAALELNYRVGEREVALLSLLTDKNWAQVFSAMVDGPTAQAMVASNVH